MGRLAQTLGLITKASRSALMNKSTRFLFLTAALLTAMLDAFAQEGVRLLPASFTKAIQFTWRQDGRVVELELSNPQREWVLQHATFVARFPLKPQEPATASTAKPKGGRTPIEQDPFAAYDAKYGREISPEDYRLDLDLQPGRKAALHIELKSDRKVLSIELLEVRGREQTYFERIKAYV